MIPWWFWLLLAAGLGLAVWISDDSGDERSEARYETGPGDDYRETLEAWRWNGPDPDTEGEDVP